MWERGLPSGGRGAAWRDGSVVRTVYTALVEDQSSVPSTQIEMLTTAYNSNPREI